MVTQNQKGQALIEMTLVMMMFVFFWLFIQKSIEGQKQGLKKWKIGHDAKIESQKTFKK